MGSQREITHGPDRGRVRIRRPAGPAPSHQVNGYDPALAAQRRETIVTRMRPNRVAAGAHLALVQGRAIACPHRPAQHLALICRPAALTHLAETRAAPEFRHSNRPPKRHPSGKTIRALRRFSALLAVEICP